jgi:hypothetical protein
MAIMTKLYKRTWSTERNAVLLFLWVFRLYNRYLNLYLERLK